MYHVIDSYHNLSFGSCKYSVLNLIVLYTDFNQEMYQQI